ncbi:MAG: metal-dependent transcriptional regulator [Firmicutes bacterium]|nr:metal-dependent transcriptional regulator [Bacillota bacterium]
MPHSHGYQSYVKAIYILGTEGEGQPATAARLAEFLNVAAPTVSQSLRRLQRKGYVTLDDHRITLTPAGYRLAESLVRRHRIVERWLQDGLGLDWATADEEAERLEQAVSPVVEQALDRLLHHPKTCPHGNPIPGNGAQLADNGQPLDKIEPGQTVVVERILETAEEIRDLLEFLGARGLYPGAIVQVLESSPYAGSMMVRCGERTFTLAPEVASNVWVYPVAQSDESCTAPNVAPG